MAEKEKIAGYVSRIMLPDGTVYGLRCEVVEIYPIICPRCGSGFEPKYGSGQCPACGTSFTTQFKLVENNQVKNG